MLHFYPLDLGESLIVTPLGGFLKQLQVEKDNRALRDIVQKYIAEIGKLKGLPPSRKI